MAIRVFHRDKPSLRVPMISKDARLIVWPGVGAKTANMNYVRIEPGESNVPHIHRDSEDTVFCLEGRGTVRDYDHGTTHLFEAGQAVHIPPGLKHAVMADRDSHILSVGGPSPPDMQMLKAAGALVAEK